MAFLADLRHLELRFISQAESCPYGKIHYRDTGRCDIFGKIAGLELHISQLCLKLIDAFPGQQADLAMPFPGVRVTLDTVIDEQTTGGNWMLPDPFF